MARKKQRVEFFDDRPIGGKKADKLGRDGFAVALAERIRAWRGRDSLVIGLTGEWGCGKTSLKNMILEKLTRNNRTGVDVLEFNPWQFSGHASLTASFFAELPNAMEKGQPNTPEKEARAKKLTLYARCAVLGGGALQYLGRATKTLGDDMAVPGAIVEASGGALAEIGGALDQAADAKKAESDVGNESMSELKVSLSKDMAKLKRPLLVVIDDMDRLTADEIRECVQLVKANADFPNVIFLLLFDRQIVADALDSISGGRGDVFLEKIIQVSFRVPQPALRDVHQVLSEGIDICLAQEGVSARWDDERWREIWFTGMRPYFVNLRTVYRFLSSLEFQIGQMRNGGTFELNPVDLLALETLRMFEPSLYEALPSNRAILVAEDAASLETMFLKDDDKHERDRVRQKALLNYVKDGRRDQARSLLKETFPCLFGSEPDYAEMRRDLRVGIREFFDRYFTLSVHSSEIPQKEIDGMLAAITQPKEFVQVCRLLSEVGKLDAAMDRLDAYNQKFSADQFPAIITSLADVGDFLSHAESATTLIPDPLQNAWRIIYFSLKRIEDENRRFEFLRDGLSASSGVSLAVHVATKEQRREQKSDNDYLTFPAHAAELKEIALLKIRNAAADGRLAHLPKLEFSLWRWSQWTEGTDETKTWVTEKIQSEKAALWFLQTIMGTRTEGAMYVRYVDLSTVERFVDIEAIKSLTDTTEVGNLDIWAMRALRAFRQSIIWRAEGRPDGYRGEYEQNGNPLAEKT